MRKLQASIVKEFLILINDKVGLLLMYLMPILLVFIITVVQDSTFKLVNENNIELLVINEDDGALGDSLSNLLTTSGLFNIRFEESMDSKEIESLLLNGDELIAVQIPFDFSENLELKAATLSSNMLVQFGLLDSIQQNHDLKASQLNLFYDPVLQENFRFSIVSSIKAYINAIENQLVIRSLYQSLGMDASNNAFMQELAMNKTAVIQKSASSTSGEIIPNSTQHNVPAWSIFAMFFMVISLGGNVVKERLSGSFVRLQTIPSSFLLVLVSKVIIYLGVALSQLALIFTIGKFVFPLIGLPELELPSNISGLIAVSTLSGLAAISFALLIGTYAKTQEQANGFGAISVIILAAIGGIWVPTFVMPHYLQVIGMVSPLHWCLEGFYTLFLKGGDWYLLYPTFLFLIIFIFACQSLVVLKLKVQNYL